MAVGEEAQIGAERRGDPKAAEQLGHSCERKTPHVSCPYVSGSVVCQHPATQLLLHVGADLGRRIFSMTLLAPTSCICGSWDDLRAD